MKQHAAKLLFSFLLAVSACGPVEAPEGRRPRNVVLVVLESVRADHVGAYGYARATTARLDALAERGLVFERAYAGSSAGPQSLSTLWTGRLPSSGGSVGLREATPHPEALTLPRMFLRAGFRTGLVSNYPGLRERAFTRGFDDIEIDSDPGRWNGALVTKKALELVDQSGDEPLFLIVDYADAREPHLPPGRFRARFDVPPPEELLSLPNLRGAAGALPAGVEGSPAFLDLVARYDAEIAYVDDCLGALVDGLRVRGLLDETLLVVTSSHGTEFLEHGYVGAAWTLYEEVLHVPLVIHAPGYLTPGRIEDPVSLADVFPSLQHLFAPEEGQFQVDGQALLESTPGGLSPLPLRGQVIAELVVPELSILRACIRSDWKMIEAIAWVPPNERLRRMASYAEIIARMQDGEIPRPDPWGAPARRELYNLAQDPQETHDLATSSAEQLALLHAELKRYAEFCMENGLASKEAERRAELPDPSALDQLQQLGYL